MARQARIHSGVTFIPIPVLFKVVSIILISIVIVLGISSPASRVALAVGPQLIDAPQRMPSLQTWSARFQEQADIYPDEEADRQRRLEAWSARYQKQ